MKKNTIAIALFIAVIGYSQDQQQGRIITDFGKTFTVENTDFKTDTNIKLKVVFDVGRSFDNSSKPNALIETAARFLNMHDLAGVPMENLNVALVIHGSAANDILNSEAYSKRVDKDININPNYELLSQLSEQGVDIILCGQTAAHRKITKDILHPDVKLALSAMTALVQLQNDGYRLINF